jgi:hypothetical protein
MNGRVCIYVSSQFMLMATVLCAGSCWPLRGQIVCLYCMHAVLTVGCLQGCEELEKVHTHWSCNCRAYSAEC